MKRFFSWVVFTLANSFVYNIGLLIVHLILWFIDWLGDKSVGILIALCIFGGSILLGLLALPFTLGIPYSIICSESICESKKGLRYVIWGVLLSIDLLLGILSTIAGSEDNTILELIYKGVFVLVLFLTYKIHLGERFD